MFVLAFLGVTFHLYARSVRLERQVTELARHIAILRHVAGHEDGDPLGLGLGDGGVRACPHLRRSTGPTRRVRISQGLDRVDREHTGSDRRGLIQNIG